MAGSIRMKRIIMHWSGGSTTVSGLDRQHYHFTVDGKGDVHPGNKKPEANLNTGDGDYMAHTRRCNTGSIGVSMAGMAGAVERPFNAGSHPLTEVQVDAFVELIADLAETYRIPVTRKTILMHSEVQETLGIKQRGKWDINWLPGMERPGNSINVGDVLRARIKAAMEDQPPDPELELGDTVSVVRGQADREHPAQSTTIQAQIIQWLTTGGATGWAAWNAADEQTRYILAGLALVGFLAGVWIFKERLRKWANGIN